MKQEFVKIIKEELEKYDDIVFAYIFGSFVDSDRYNDIDVAIFLKNPEKHRLMEREFELERILEDKIHISFDVRIINFAPISFVYNVLKNKILIIDRDSSLRADFESLIFREYFDYKHLIKEYLKEIKNVPI